MRKYVSFEKKQRFFCWNWWFCWLVSITAYGVDASYQVKLENVSLSDITAINTIVHHYIHFIHPHDSSHIGDMTSLQYTSTIKSLFSKIFLLHASQEQTEVVRI